ncbi:MAG: hypothetical protein J0H08_09290 [Rhizobiales bacterium]|nr:hypothetical protein [Hyphomicrobiales bacterium]
MKSDDEKAEEILQKRRLAAKGLKERGDGKPVDPLADMTSLDPDDKRTEVDPLAEPEPSLAKAAALGRVR